jgi:hypothetical protein
MVPQIPEDLCQPGTPEVPETLLLVDDFSDSHRWGRVIGTRTRSAARREGVDSERSLSIQGDALRIRPPVKTGWGRCVLAYGPIELRPGTAAAVHLLNGHHGSQGYRLPSIRRQLRMWREGSHTNPPDLRRTARLFLDRRREPPLRRVRSWYRNWRRDDTLERESLAVGWTVRPESTFSDGHSAGFVIRTAEWDNGDLMASVGSELLPVAVGLANAPLHLVLLVRGTTVALYGASLEDSQGLAAYPGLRPLAIVPFEPGSCYLAIQQAVLGEIGFSIDTRAYDVRVASLPHLAAWYGTAHVAEEFTGPGPLGVAAGSARARWVDDDGTFERSASGAVAGKAGRLAVIDPQAPSGLVRASCEPGAAFGLVWRAAPDAHARVELTDTAWRLIRHRHGDDHLIGEGSGPRGVGATSMQIFDDGRHLRVSRDSHVLYEGSAEDLPPGTGVGLRSDRVGPLGVHQIEAHPRSVCVPTALRVPSVALVRPGVTEVDDSFEGAPGELSGRACATGDWERTEGEGHFELDGPGHLQVRATPTDPFPGRTIYTVPWPHSDFAEVKTTLELPRSRPGEAEKCRAGVVLWQDSANMVLLNLWTDDTRRPFASTSTFFVIDGHEDVYDAVWTNVGRLIGTGPVHELAVAFDGMEYYVRLDDELVLWRSIRDVYPKARRLAIRRVGLLVNWEWGNDTGSRFHRFRVRSRSVD